MKFAVVTGASTGIGKVVAVELEKRGYAVARVARREKGELACDLSDVLQVDSLIQKIKAKYDHTISDSPASWRTTIN